MLGVTVVITDQNGLMGRNGDGEARRVLVGGGNENDVGEARAIGARVVVIDRRPELEKSNLSFQVFDLSLQLFLGLVRLLVALLARACVT